MPRQTSAEINAEIVDRAAALFARRGFDHTSLQQVADEVGYTKAGLLYRFPSKQAIYDAVLDVVHKEMVALRAAAEQVPAGAERDRVLVESLIDLTYAWPGVSAFAATLTSGEVPGEATLQAAGLELLRAFAVDPENADEERIVRLVSACAGLSVVAMEAMRAERTREWREMIIDTAMDALGHGRRTSAERAI